MRAVFTYGLKHAYDCQLCAVVVAGLDGAAVNKDGGNVHAGDGDHGAGHVFVAATDGEQAVHALRLADSLDGIGNYLARDQAVAHALSAHGDAVAHGDGAEDLRHGPGFRQRIRSARGQIVQAEIAGSEIRVGVGHADDGLGEVGVFEADSAQHGAVGRALYTSGDCFAAD